jgi:short-subunit dehydrogenase
MRFIITGATDGIGLSCTRSLCAEGHEVIGIARSTDNLQALQNEYSGFTGVTCDISDTESLERLGNTLQSIINDGAVDVLINNAGYGAAGPIELVSIAEWKAQYDTNVFGAVGVTQSALPFLRNAKRARIINVSSIAGSIYAPFFAPYYSSKHALENISNILRLELRDQNIDVIVVRPGAVKTGFSSKEDDMLEKFSKESPRYRESIRKMINWHKKIVLDGIEPDPVRDVILTAAQTESPKARYTIPAFPANIVVPLLKLLPTRMADALVRLLIRLLTR